MDLPGTVPEVTSVERLSLRPGDLLVLRVDWRLTAEQYDRLSSDAEKNWGLPEGVKVVVLDRGMSLQVFAPEDT